jgi:hypothetical protein
MARDSEITNDQITALLQFDGKMHFTFIRKRKERKKTHET